MSFLLIFSLAACGNTQQTEETESTANSETIADDVISDIEDESSEEVIDKFEERIQIVEEHLNSGTCLSR